MSNHIPFSCLPPLRVEWRTLLADELELPYLANLDKFLKSERAAGKDIYPATNDVFSAFERTAPEDVKVVIVGQDPYFSPGQAHGLSFSVPEGVRIPSSLRNIFKELEADLGIALPPHGCLTDWADRGVLLINGILTVEKGKKKSHNKRGWEQFTDAVIREIDRQREGIVFFLWGIYAQKKASFVDTARHHVISSSHPSGMSAYRGFLGSKPFSRANAFLESAGRSAVDWSLIRP